MLPTGHLTFGHALMQAMREAIAAERFAAFAAGFRRGYLGA